MKQGDDVLKCAEYEQAILWPTGCFGLTLHGNGKCQTDATVLCFQFICSHEEFKGQRGKRAKNCFDVTFNSTGWLFDPIQSHQLL